MAIRIGGGDSPFDFFDRFNKDTEKSLAKLASGKRITSAAEDAAGLGISEQLKKEFASLGQARNNVDYGAAEAQIAEGAMGQQSEIMSRMQELAVQASNGTLSATDRQFIDKEASALASEMNRIANTTEFNGSKVLSTDSGNVTIQSGTKNGQTMNVTYANTTNASLGVSYGAGQAVDFSTAATAQASLANIQAGMATLSSSRAQVGADTNALEVQGRTLAVQRENTEAARSRIADTDYAAETANLAQSQILSQANLAIHAHRNLMSQSALDLLKG